MNTATKTGINAAKNFGDKYDKNLMDTVKKKETNFAKTAGKKYFKKNAEATRDLVGNKIGDKITSFGKSKIKKKKIKQTK